MNHEIGDMRDRPDPIETLAQELGSPVNSGLNPHRPFLSTGPPSYPIYGARHGVLICWIWSALHILN